MTRLFYTLEKIPIFFDIKIFHPNKTQVYNRFLYFLNAFLTLVHKNRIKNNNFSKINFEENFTDHNNFHMGWPWGCTVELGTGQRLLSTWAGLGDARWNLTLGRDFFPDLTHTLTHSYSNAWFFTTMAQSPSFGQVLFPGQR